jgi:hypothetical protein
MSEFLVHTSALLTVLLFCRWYYSSWISALEKVIWIGLIGTFGFFILQGIVECYLGMVLGCSSLPNISFFVLFFIPDLVFLGFSNLVFRLGRVYKSHAEVDQRVQDVPDDSDPFFVLCKALCLVFGTIWRYLLTSI